MLWNSRSRRRRAKMVMRRNGAAHLKRKMVGWAERAAGNSIAAQSKCTDIPTSKYFYFVPVCGSANECASKR